MTRQITLPDGTVLTLSPDQDRAVSLCLDALQERASEAVLAGAAGTGKTTVMNAILSEWKGGILFMAPTGKAAHRLEEQTGKATCTIHSGVYKTVEEGQGGDRREQLIFGEPDTPRGCNRSTLVVVDEASMVGEKVANTLREVVFAVGARILWVGDHEQLPPVDGTGSWGADLTNPTAKLTQVHRQALESPVLELATLIRQGEARTFTNWGEEVTRHNPATIEQAVEWSEEARAAEALMQFGTEEDMKNCPTRILLTWTNKVRTRANRLTRQSRKYPKGEVVAKETLLCIYNNHSLGKMNGEAVEVARVEKCEELSECLGTLVQWVIEAGTATRRLPAKGDPKETKYLVIPATFDAFRPNKSDRGIYRDAWKPLWALKHSKKSGDENVYQLIERMGWSWNELRQWRNAAKEYGLQATWGYCLTVHKSQGSQWDEVGFISCPGFRRFDDKEFKRRLTYTAVTRAVERFTAFMLSVVPNYNRKDPYGGKQ
tara:strand:+ start:207 stop:1670 length:1464 start_codon:yes stop_codon:yes gene_type:complete